MTPTTCSAVVPVSIAVIVSALMVLMVWATIKKRWILAGTMALVQSFLCAVVARLAEVIIVNKLYVSLTSRLYTGLTVFYFFIGVFFLAVVNKAFQRQK